MASQKKTTVLTSLALVFGLGLAGCSGDAPDTSSNTNGESQQSQQEETAASSTITADDFAERIEKAQLEAGSVHMVIESKMGDLSTVSEADVKLGKTAADTAMRMTTDAGGGATLEMLLIGGEAYMNMGAATENKYAKISTDQFADDSFTEALDETNPAAQAELYKESLKDFTAEEGEEIDGVKTTKLTLELDTRALLEQSGEVDEQVLATLGETIEIIMFVGDDDLPRRVISTMGETSSTVNYTKWGEPVEVTAPAEEDLAELPF